MTILHSQCLPTELEKPANQAVIAATFADCSGTPLTPGTQLATCNDIPAIPAAQTLSLAGQSLTLSGGGGTVTLPDSDNQTLSISGNTLTISGGNAVTLPSAPASAIAIQDEGTVQGNAGTLNFVGPGVSASVSAGVATVTIPGPAAPTPVGIQDEGAPVVATPSAINFVGAGVTVTDVGGVATVTVPAGGASHTTTLGTCPATGPTVAPTTEGHYFWTSTIGEKWCWIYGDAAPFVCGKFYSTGTVWATLNYNGSGIAHYTFVAPRAGIVHVDWTFNTAAPSPTYSDVVAAILKNGVGEFAYDRATAGVGGWNANQSCSATFDVVQGDVIGFYGRNVSNTNLCSGARSVTYQA